VSLFPYLIAMALFLFGLWLMSVADVVTGFEAAVFFGGILCASAALAIPINVLGRRESGI
jgi:hypothetical protein